MNKRFLSFLLALVLCAGMTSVPAHAAGTFSDVTASHWGYSYIEKAASLGLVEGVGHGRFAPDQTVHYTEFLTMVTRFFLPADMEYWKGKAGEGALWWAPYAMAADRAGYLDGTIPGATLDPDASPENQVWQEPVFATAVSRYEMALILFRLAVLEGLAMPAETQLLTAEASIPDREQIPESYRTAVAYCYASGLLQGVDPEGTFRGTGTMNRAQAAAVLCRLADASGDLFTAVTLNGVDYTVPELRYYYAISQGMMAYYANLYRSYYGVDIGYDPSADDGSQWANDAKTVTWADAFRDDAVGRLQETEALCSAAKEAGYALPDSARAEMEGVLASLDSESEKREMNRDFYLTRIYGRGVTEEIFLRNYERDLLAESYANKLQAGFTYTDEQLEEYYHAHAAELDPYLNEETTWKDVTFQTMSRAELDTWVAARIEEQQLQFQDGMNYVGAKNAV